jgi:uncharacterized membrane protein
MSYIKNYLPTIKLPVFNIDPNNLANYSLYGAPIFMYSMMGITSAILAYVTLIDVPFKKTDSIVEAEKAAEKAAEEAAEKAAEEAAEEAAEKAAEEAAE